MTKTNYFGGIDVGSTTVKIVVMDQANQTVFSRYERHYSDVKGATEKILREAISELGKDAKLACTITGSGGIGLANLLQLKFVQEVIACTKILPRAIIFSRIEPANTPPANPKA